MLVVHEVVTRFEPRVAVVELPLTHREETKEPVATVVEQDVCPMSWPKLVLDPGKHNEEMNRPRKIKIIKVILVFCFLIEKWMFKFEK